jgi:hypothetical protein
MFKDNPHKTKIGTSVFDKQPIYEKLIEFIKKHISEFPEYLTTVSGNIEKENHITAPLDDYLGDRVREDNLPYKFQNQTPDRDSNRITDIAVKIQRSEKGKFHTENSAFCWIEAKRLKFPNHSNEYVFGDTGGIERFKRGHHAPKLLFSIMVGYIQDHDANYWLERVNDKIMDLSKNSTDGTIEWSEQDKLQSENGDLFSIFLAKSENSRLKQNDKIILHHYWVKVY